MSGDTARSDSKKASPAAAGTGEIRVRRTRPQDFDRIVELSRRIYADPWRREQIESHLRVFPEGQLVAVATDDRVVGTASALVIDWDDYDPDESWRDFTDGGMFANHDPAGRTLYGAEILVDPDVRRAGVGSALYRVRRELVRRLGLWRIRAHSRLAGYHRNSDEMDAEEYVRRVVRGELSDPTLSFQLAWGFRVLAVVSGYLQRDPHSLGYAALIEWINAEAAPPEAIARRPERFA